MTIYTFTTNDDISYSIEYEGSFYVYNAINKLYKLIKRCCITINIFDQKTVLSNDIDLSSFDEKKFIIDIQEEIFISVSCTNKYCIVNYRIQSYNIESIGEYCMECYGLIVPKNFILNRTTELSYDIPIEIINDFSEKSKEFISNFDKIKKCWIKSVDNIKKIQMIGDISYGDYIDLVNKKNIYNNLTHDEELIIEFAKTIFNNES